MESKRMHTSALCALHSVSAGQASFDGSQRRASVTQARVRPCHANVVHTSQVSRPDYPQREAIYFPGHLPSLSLSLGEVVGGGWQGKFRITRHKLPRRFPRQNIVMAPGKAPSRTQQMCRCMRENASPDQNVEQRLREPWSRSRFIRLSSVFLYSGPDPRKQTVGVAFALCCSEFLRWKIQAGPGTRWVE